MSIKDKATYGEYYWAMQVEAQNAYYEGVETDLASHFRGLFGDIIAVENLQPGMKRFLSSFIEPESQAMGAVGLRFASEVGDMFVGQALQPYARVAAQALEAKVLSNILTPTEATVLKRRKKITDGLYDTYVHFAGYPDIQADNRYKALEPYPSIPDLVLWSRYHGDPKNVWSTIQKYYDLDAVDYPLWDWLGLQRLTTEQVHTLFRRGLFTESNYKEEMSRIGWSDVDTNLLKQSEWFIPNAMLLVQGNLQQKRSQSEILSDISKADINPDYAQQYLDAILTKPASQDIISYNLRMNPSLPTLDADLQQIGIHPDYTHIYKELAYQIPPINDIITMAVREAFSPSIAARFGQYEDFPPEFGEWAQKKGLSKEWSQRYWAAHWSLPSTLQGFDMLHRGIITRDELAMLLRALDVMPFWRDRLMQMSYHLLTRVDVRRMFKAGVLTEAQVYESYLQIGYDSTNARRMTEFTIQWATPEHHSITRSDILTAYKNRMIDKSEASELLAAMGEELFHRDFMLESVDYKKALEQTQNRIDGIKKLYLRTVYDNNKATDELLKLDLPADEVSDLLDQWFYDIQAKVPRLWTTAQTLGFMKDGLITQERGIKELETIGYDTEHITVYLAAMK